MSHFLTALIKQRNAAKKSENTIALLIGACILCGMPDPGVSRVIGIPSMGFVCFLLAIILMIYVLRGIGKD